ncbi:MAG: PqqD family protein, partial [Gammaproteobacteria bacterium]|nr:PqqD family protein [Gammaproteobacteria bacterium]
LPDKGLWINTGTLAFFHRDPCRRYSEAEVLELIEEAGFELLSLDHRNLPYMNSPHSGHGRTERIVTFAVQKVRDVIPGHRRGYLPDWAQDPSLPIPSTMTSTLQASSQLLKAQVLAAIDGKRSIDAIAVMVSREYGLTQEECRLAIQRMLAEICDAELTAFGPW